MCVLAERKKKRYSANAKKKEGIRLGSTHQNFSPTELNFRVAHRTRKLSPHRHQQATPPSTFHVQLNFQFLFHFVRLLFLANATYKQYRKAIHLSSPLFPILRIRTPTHIYVFVHPHIIYMHGLCVRWGRLGGKGKCQYTGLYYAMPISQLQTLDEKIIFHFIQYRLRLYAGVWARGRWWRREKS